MSRFPVMALLLLAVVTTTSCPAEDETPKSEFDVAKETYDSEVGKLNEAITAAIEKRLAVAQATGNVNRVNSVLAEQKAFDEYADIPQSTPAGQQQKLTQLARIMDKAYVKELRNLTTSGQVAEADALTKEYREFRKRIAIRNTRSLLMGTWKLEMGNYDSNFTFYPDGTMFHSTENFHGTWKIDLETQRIIVAPPVGTGRDRINLPLNPRGTKGLSSNGGVFKLTKN